MSTTYTSGNSGSDHNVVRAFGVMGEQRIVNRSTALRSGSLTAIASELTLDLVDAQLAPEGAVLDVTSVLGQIRILVPPGWRVAVHGSPVAGSIKNKGGGAETATGPELLVRATAVFGEVKVKRSS
jgi:predicted membrane protein